MTSKVTIQRLVTGVPGLDEVLGGGLHDAHPVFTVADGLIWLRQSVLRNSMVRKIEILKMRGQATLPGRHAEDRYTDLASAHSDELREYTIDATDMHINQQLPDQEGLLGGRPTRKNRSPRLTSDHD